MPLHLTTLERVNREALAIQGGTASMVAWPILLEVAVAALNVAILMR